MPIRRRRTRIPSSRPRRIGATSHLGQQSERAQSDARSHKDASGTPREFADRRIPASASKARSILRRKLFPDRAKRASSRCVRAEDRRSTRSSTRASARIICSSLRTPTTRCGRAAAGLSSAGSTRKNSTRRAMQRLRKVGHRSCSIRTAMASSTSGPSRINRPMRKLDTRIAGGFYAVMPNPADGSVWGSVAFAIPVACCASIPRSMLSEIYNVPLPGYGVRGADIDRNGVVWVSLGSGHLGEFDRRKCKVAAERPESDRRSLSGRLDTSINLPGPSFAETDRIQRRVQLLHLGRSAQHARPRRATFRSPPAICSMACTRS